MSKQIKTNLAYLRFINGRLSQRAVSDATGIGQKTLSALETGASKGIEFNTLIRLCLFFHCTPSDLFTIEEEEEDISISNESRSRARDIVARGLKRAMNAQEANPDEVWAEFDSIRARMQDTSDSVEINKEKRGRMTKRA